MSEENSGNNIAYFKSYVTRLSNFLRLEVQTTVEIEMLNSQTKCNTMLRCCVYGKKLQTFLDGGKI